MAARLLLIWTLFATGLPVYSQSQKAFIITAYNTENGLPANGIKGIAFDRKTNFLWVATEAGICRFNGQDIKTFTPRQIPQLSSERISKLVMNAAGNILLIDERRNIFKIINNKPLLYKQPATEEYKNYNRLLSVCISNPGLAAALEGADNKLHFNINGSVIDQEGKGCLVTTNWNEIFYIKPGIPNPDTLLPKGMHEPRLFKSGKDAFYMNHKGETFHIEPEKRSIEPVVIETDGMIFSPEQVMKGFFGWDENEKTTLFILEKKAYLLTYNGKKLQAALICDQIPENSNIRYAIFQKDYNQIIIGTHSKGIIIIRPSFFRTIKKKDNNPLIPNATYTQIEVGYRQILTNDAIIIGENHSTPAKYPFSGPIGLSTVPINDSLLLFSTRHRTTKNNTVHSFNYKTSEVRGYSQIRINSTFSAAYSNQKIFIATNRGFGFLEADSLHYLVKTKPGPVSGHSPFEMAELSPGVFLVVSCNGLIKMDANSRKTDTLLSFTGNCFRTIRKIGDYYFIGTYGAGYYLYKDGILKPMPLDKERYLLYAHCFIPDNKGFCWISTNRGLFKASIADITRAFDENAKNIYYHYFGKNDGIEMTELNGGCNPCAIQMKDGTFSFPSMDGLLWVHPDSISGMVGGMDIFIDEIISEDSVITANFESLVLPATTKSITIKLSYNGWTNKENIYLDYKLGNSGNWKPVLTKEGANIQIDNPPPGNYRVTIRKMNGFGAGNFTYKTISFYIDKPWYNRWWFYLACAAALMALVRLYLHYKTRTLESRRLLLEKQVNEKTKALRQKNDALEKNNRLQTRLISIISHDIITPLKFMAVGGKELMDKKEIMPESLKQETIEEITNTAQELQLLSTNIMNWIKYQNEHRQQEKEQLNLFAVTSQVAGIHRSFTRHKNIVVQNLIPPGLTAFQYLEPLKILLYNLLSNAINFSAQGKISVTAVQNDAVITLKVSDEGVGMTPEQIKNILSGDFIISSANIDNRKGNGLGYLIIKDLLKMIDGKLDIESKKGQGTTVTITFPAL